MSNTGAIPGAKSQGAVLTAETAAPSTSMPGTSTRSSNRRSVPQVPATTTPACSGPLPVIVSESLASRASPGTSMAGSLGLAVEPSSKVLSLLTASSAHQGASQSLTHNSKSNAVHWDGTDAPFHGGTSPTEVSPNCRGPNSAPISRMGPSYSGSNTNMFRSSTNKPGSSAETSAHRLHVHTRAVSASGPNAIPANWESRGYEPSLLPLADSSACVSGMPLLADPSGWDNSSSGLDSKLLSPSTVLVPFDGGVLSAQELPGSEQNPGGGAEAGPELPSTAGSAQDNAPTGSPTTKSKPVGYSWHEVEVLPLMDPVTRSSQLLLLQTDITGRAQLEASMAALTESQLSMLEQMFPRHVLEYMVGSQVVADSSSGQPDLACLAHNHTGVTILFTDIVGFTTMSKEVPPTQVMTYLNDLFTLFDALVDSHGCYKVETAGDCYIAAGGLMCQDKDGFVALDHTSSPSEGAAKILSFAQALIRHAGKVRMPHDGSGTVVRVGLHTGPVVTGLIGTKLPKFSIFGDTMNTASRMESCCSHGCIQISAATYEVLDPARRQGFKATGGVEVKGLGVMETYIWDPAENPEPEASRLSNEGGSPGSDISAVSGAWDMATGGGSASVHPTNLNRSSSQRVGMAQLGFGMSAERSSATTAFRAAAALLNLAAVEAGTHGAVGQYRLLGPQATSRDASDVGSAQSDGRVLLPGQTSVGSTHTSRTSRRSGKSHASGVSGVSVHSFMSTAARRHPLLGLLRARAATGQHANVLSSWAGASWLSGEGGAEDDQGGEEQRLDTTSAMYTAVGSMDVEESAGGQ